MPSTYKLKENLIRRNKKNQKMKYIPLLQQESQKTILIN